MIIVSGATGQLGQRIVEQLRARIPAARLGVSVRDPQRAASLAARGVRVRRGDFADPSSLQHAFEGGRQLLLVSSNAAAYGGDTLVQHRAAITAAKAAGMARVVYTSQMAASRTSAFPPARDHAATEDMLRESGLAWTALRNGFYASSAMYVLGPALEHERLETPAEGRIAWTSHDDLAEAAAIILTREGMFDGATPPLTARSALDFGSLCAEASSILGRPLAHALVSEDVLRTKLAALGLPASAVERTLGLFEAAREGEFDKANATLETLLGRAPRTMRSELERMLARSAEA